MDNNENYNNSSRRHHPGTSDKIMDVSRETPDVTTKYDLFDVLVPTRTQQDSAHYDNYCHY